MDILHIVSRDKFTVGYVNFMQITYPEEAHYFVIRDNGAEQYGIGEGAFFLNRNIFFVKKYGEWAKLEQLRHIFLQADKIIITGIFDTREVFANYNEALWSKTYLQFWGGDFYFLRDALHSDEYKTKNNALLYLKNIARCYGHIFLIHGEIEEFRRITGISQNRFFVAPMPGDPRYKMDYTAYRKGLGGESNHTRKRIIIGNSATKESHHLEVFAMLKKLSGIENVEIICPLSYGKDSYKNSIVKEGKRLFGERFIPLVDFLPYEKYVKLLNTCDAGIFYVDRQQAMGNILVLLELGKKVFIRRDISMWQEFVARGVTLFEADSIACAKSIEEVVFIDDKVVEDNILANREYLSHYGSMWDAVIDDEVKQDLEYTAAQTDYIERVNYQMRMCKEKMLKKVIIYGAGNIGELALKYYKNKFEVVFIVDKDKRKHGKLLDGVEIKTPEELKKNKGIKVIIASTFYAEILSEIQDFGLVDVEVFRIGTERVADLSRTLETELDSRVLSVGEIIEQAQALYCKELTFIPGTSGILDYFFIKAVAKLCGAKKYVEIGTYIGESINILTDSCDELYSITAPLEASYSMHNWCKKYNLPDYSDRLTYSPQIRHIYANSLEYDFFQLPKDIDLFFIDGDHSFDGVYSDTMNVFKIRSKDAVVIWHDFKISRNCYNLPVIQAVHAALGDDFKNVYVMDNNISGIYVPEKYRLLFGDMLHNGSADDNSCLFTYNTTLEIVRK